MGSIADLNVKLTANISSFASSMASATRPVASFAGSVTGAAAKIGGLVSAVAGLVGAGSLVALTHSSMEAIDVNTKLADRLGFTTEQLVGLQHAGALSGVSSEQLTGSLEKMMKTMSEAANASAGTSTAYSQLGLDAKKLVNESPDAAFKEIADALKGVENPAQRAALAMEIFGKAGQGTLNLLMSGSEGISRAQEEAAKLGMTFSRIDAAKVEQANESLIRMEGVVTGVGNQLAIQLAPFIDVVTSKLVDMATSGDGMGGKVLSAFEAVTKGVAYASDYLSLLKAGFKLLQVGATAAVLGIVWAIDKLAHGIANISKLLGHKMDTSFLDQFTEGLEQDVHRLSAEAGKSFDSFKNGDNAKTVGKAFDDIRTKSQAAAEAAVKAAPKMNGAFNEVNADNIKKVADTLNEIQKQYAEVGMTENQKKLTDLKAEGATDQQIAGAKRLLDIQDQIKLATEHKTNNPLADFTKQMDAMLDLYNKGKLTLDQLKNLGETAKKSLNDRLSEESQSIIDQVKTPLEKYQEELEKLNAMMQRGLISKQQFDRASAQAKISYNEATLDRESPKLLKSGSADAQKYSYEQSRGLNRLTNDPVPKKQLAEAQQQNLWLERIERNQRNVDPAPAEVDI